MLSVLSQPAVLAVPFLCHLHYTTDNFSDAKTYFSPIPKQIKCGTWIYWNVLEKEGNKNHFEVPLLPSSSFLCNSILSCVRYTKSSSLCPWGPCQPCLLWGFQPACHRQCLCSSPGILHTGTPPVQREASYPGGQSTKHQVQARFFSPLLFFVLHGVNPRALMHLACILPPSYTPRPSFVCVRIFRS